MIISTEEEHILNLIEKARQGNLVRVLGVGNSMRPFLKDGRDFIDLVAVDKDTILKKNDVIFYQSWEDKYVLHRIHSVSKEGCYPIGDGNITIEPFLERDRIYLKAVGFLRKGRYIGTNSIGYRCYVKLWVALLPVRGSLLRWYHRFNKLISILRKENRNEN